MVEANPALVAGTKLGCYWLPGKVETDEPTEVTNEALETGDQSG